MMQRFTTALILALALFSWGCKSAPKSTRGLSAYLFNGKNLKGWAPVNGGSWAVEEGVIVGRKGVGWAVNPDAAGSWLRTDKTYGDFLLELEYNLSETSNSGVFIRAAQDKNPAFTGYEIQLLPDAGKPASKSSTGALYDVIAPLRSMAKPAGEWNRLRVLAKGSKVQVSVNGVLVVDTDAPRSVKGFIGLQVHDDKSTVKFRNLRITEL